MLSGLSGDPFSPNDKPAGGEPDEVKRIASDQRKDLIFAGIQHFDGGWTHYLGGHHAIAVLAEQRGKRDNVVLPDVSQRPEERVAVPGNTYVSGPSW